CSLACSRRPSWRPRCVAVPRSDVLWSVAKNGSAPLASGRCIGCILQSPPLRPCLHQREAPFKVMGTPSPTPRRPSPSGRATALASTSQWSSAPPPIGRERGKPAGSSAAEVLAPQALLAFGVVTGKRWGTVSGDFERLLLAADAAAASEARARGAASTRWQ